MCNTRINRIFLYFIVITGLISHTGCSDSDSDSPSQGPGSQVTGPLAKVETTRDDQGIWYITGPENARVYDIFEAMGYAVATDRLWQLEQYRRVGGGRLSELLGQDLVDTDTYVLTLGYSHAEIDAIFNALDAESQALIQGYVDGINRRIADVRADRSLMPYEFTIIYLQQFDFTPDIQDWTIYDLFGWIAVLQRDFDGEARSQKEIENAALYNELQERFPNEYAGMFDDLRWTDDPDALTYIPDRVSKTSPKMTSDEMSDSGSTASAQRQGPLPDLRQAAANMAQTRKKVLDSLKRINAYVKMGSYGWVVSGEKTASGNPILYSGPQMGLPVPSIVVEGSIRAGGLNISGMTVPGMPGLIVSRTPHQALAMMTGHVNSVDYYIENPSDVFLHRTETIKISGQRKALSLPVYRSIHGPVISPMPYDPATYDPDTDGPIITWKYSHWGHVADSTTAFLKFVRAASIDEFAEAMEYFPASFHVLYADTEGNIAYWMTGRDPVRPAGEWRLPQGFLAPHLEWDAEILIARSADRNPSQGYYGGWNNRSSAAYDAPYGPFHRAHVVDDYLSTHNSLTYEEVRNLALNVATTDSFGLGGNPWKFVEANFTAVVNANWTAERSAALDIMADWDGHFVAGGEPAWAEGTDRADGWMLMDSWIRKVIELTFEDELGSGEDEDESNLDYRDLFNVLLHGLPGTTINNHYKWFQNLSDAGAPQTSEAIILTALDSALVDLGPRPWGKDARGQQVFHHPVLAAAGDGDVHTIPFSSRSTYAQCVEYDSSGPVRIESMFPLGESGHINTKYFFFFPQPDLSPNFLGMTEAYDDFSHRPFPLFD